MIGIHGKKRCGKDTCAKIIKKHTGMEIYSLANPIKEAIAYATELSMDDLNGFTVDRDKHVVSLSLNQYHSMLYYLHKRFESMTLCEIAKAFEIIKSAEQSYTIRRLMQFIGTDLMVSVRCDYWLSNLDLNNNIIIADVRQKHEIDFVRKHGEMIFINKDTNLVDDHITERGLSPMVGEFIVTNDGTIDELEHKIKEYLKGKA